ncbi:EAL domain-containing protein [Halopseudomonas pelagia]|uniref:EAL domain-containing protein n=1 Tax=Halopseudomonas pelagia TaxID=553151 RepID=UPI0003A1F07A|nr:EAL domain-containing protein [Halopseudomonas pelagia]
MLDLKKKLQEMQTHLGLNPVGIRQRMTILALEDDHLAQLSGHAAEIEELHLACAEALHQHFCHLPELTLDSEYPGLFARLPYQRLRYCQQLLQGPYDMQHVRMRVLSNLGQERGRLASKSCLAAYHFYLQYMHAGLSERWSERPEIAQRLYGCLLRAVFFDMGLAVDTHAAASQMALDDSDARYARTVLCANDGLWEWQVDNDRMQVSERWLSILELDAVTAPRTLDDWLSRMPPSHRHAFNDVVQRHLAGDEQQVHLECQLRKRDGELVWVLIRGLVCVDAHGQRLLTGSQTDISQRKAAERELAHSSLHDPLTGLPNRQSMNELLLQASQRQSRPGARHAAVLFIDLDRFKLINDSLGHHAGDLVLIQVANRIEHCLRPGDHLCRFGGDEFVVLLDDMAAVSDAELVARHIMDALHQPIVVINRRLTLSASIGVAALNGHDGEQDALREADLALDLAKASGKAQMALYSDVLQQDAHHRLEMESALNDALRRDQFEIHYQPIVEIAATRSRVVGVEALLRWRRGDRLVPPDEFISVLEETGAIVEVGEWVLREACRQVLHWHAHGHQELRCSVNLSSRQLQQSGFAEVVARVLRETGFPATSLVLEITESLLMQEGPETLATLRELESSGVRIALDDFGTGFSSLGYLHRYPLHIIKIDKSFITKATGDERLKAIVRAIIGLGRGLCMDIIAEGIETPEQMEFLHAEGCQFVQGYWFGRPQPAAVVKPLLDSMLDPDFDRHGAAPALLH